MQRCPIGRDACTAEHTLLFQTLALVISFAFGLLTKLPLLRATKRRRFILQICQRGERGVVLVVGVRDVGALKNGRGGDRRDGRREGRIVIGLLGDCSAQQRFKREVVVLDTVWLGFCEVKLDRYSWRQSWKGENA